MGVRAQHARQPHGEAIYAIGGLAKQILAQELGLSVDAGVYAVSVLVNARRMHVAIGRDRGAEYNPRHFPVAHPTQQVLSRSQISFDKIMRGNVARIRVCRRMKHHIDMRPIGCLVP